MTMPSDFADFDLSAAVWGALDHKIWSAIRDRCERVAFWTAAGNTKAGGKTSRVAPLPKWMTSGVTAERYGRDRWTSDASAVSDAIQDGATRAFERHATEPHPKSSPAMIASYAVGAVLWRLREIDGAPGRQIIHAVETRRVATVEAMRVTFRTVERHVPVRSGGRSKMARTMVSVEDLTGPDGSALERWFEHVVGLLSRETTAAVEEAEERRLIIAKMPPAHRSAVTAFGRWRDGHHGEAAPCRHVVEHGSDAVCASCGRAFDRSRDLRRALDWTRERLGLPPRRTKSLRARGLIGQRHGGAVTVAKPSTKAPRASHPSFDEARSIDLAATWRAVFGEPLPSFEVLR